MSNSFFIYITSPSIDEARAISNTLVQEKLIACANIINPVESIYFWEGEVKSESEVSVILKTSEQRVQEVIARVKVLHSYDCPCIAVLPIAGGHSEFLQWIHQQTKN